MRKINPAISDPRLLTDTADGEVYLAGERVPAGIYRQIGSPREICLEHTDVLPASLDGRVACYERLLYTWQQIRQTHAAHAEADSSKPG